jgi:LPXTG-motif cell wall-anchored protein
MPSITKRTGPPAGLFLFLRICVARAVAMISVPFLASSSSAAPNDNVVVCKYVSTPGGVLDHVVIVDESTLGNANQPWPGTFPFIWTDAQGQTEVGSIALRYAQPGEQAHDVEVSGECPQEPPPPTDACPNLGGDQPEGFQCEPETDTETRDLGPLLDCDAGTITTLHQERSRTQTFNEETQEWEWGDFSDWETVDTTVEDATAADCPVDNPPEPILPPEEPPAPAPTLPNTGASPYLTALGLMGGLILTAGSALFMRSRKVRVPKA